MTLIEAMHTRHSVRSYTNRDIEPEKQQALQALIDRCNSEGNMHIQLVTNNPEAFESRMARYGKFRGVRNFLAIVGKRGSNLDERAGYYGERLVLEAQRLGLNTCWVGLTYSKRKAAVTIESDDKLVCLIVVGYGVNAGVPHKVKLQNEVSKVKNIDFVPVWFTNGVNAALLAPTALNQQKFKFTLLDGNKVHASASLGYFTKVDLGIVKLHFELGVGDEKFEWV